MPVLLPVALNRTYDYLLRDGVTAAPGNFVLVSFGAQARIGIVWDAPFADGRDMTNAKLKAVAGVLAEVPPLPVLSLRFAEWVARYTLSPLGMVARMMMGPSALFERVEPRFGVKRNDGQPRPARMTPARKRVLDIAEDGLIRAKGALASQAGCSAGVIDGLVAAGALVEVEIPERRFAVPCPEHGATTFSHAQQEAVAALRATSGAFSVTLLDGVTGSGTVSYTHLRAH